MKKLRISAARITALGGIIASLSLLILLFSLLFPVMSLTLPAIAGLLLCVVVMEIGARFGLCVYFVVSVLTFLLPVHRESAILYVLFFGIYPILKYLFERMDRLMCWSLKLIVFNLSAAISYLLFSSAFGFNVILEASQFSNQIGFSSDVILLGTVLLFFANLCFLLYDYAVSIFIKLYRLRFQKLWHKLKR